MKPILPALFLCMALPYFSLAQSCATAQGDQVTYGTNNVWIGYVYDNIDLTSYSGYVNQGSSASPDFDQNFGGENVTYATNGCGVNTTTFSVRYRLQKTFTNASYTFTVGGDDGYRLSVDGGATWLINRWVDQGYATSTTTVTLSGTHNLVLEYYENGGQNRISFAMIQNCAGTENTNVYGANNIWNGYIYSGTDFENYKGMVTQGTVSSPNFDQNFGGTDVIYPTSACGVQTEYFSARYRLTRSFPMGQYRFIVGGDDGYRLSLDGGANWVINNWTAHSYTSTTYTANLSGSYNMVLEYFENASDNRLSFTLQTMILLPVNLTSFSGQEKNGISELKWKIMRESDPEWFDVQRSTDGASFVTINRLPGQAGSVQTSEVSYIYKDAVPAPGSYYYRLKMTDSRGSISFSPVIMVGSHNAVAGPTKVFPTMMTNRTLYIQPGNTLHNASYQVYDQNGRLVYKQAPGRLEAGQVVAVFSGSPSLSKGVYILKLKDGDQEISQHRFIIPD